MKDGGMRSDVLNGEIMFDWLPIYNWSIFFFLANLSFRSISIQMSLFIIQLVLGINGILFYPSIIYIVHLLPSFWLCILFFIFIFHIFYLFYNITQFNVFSHLLFFSSIFCFCAGICLCKLIARARIIGFGKLRRDNGK